MLHRIEAIGLIGQDATILAHHLVMTEMFQIGITTSLKLFINISMYLLYTSTQMIFVYFFFYERIPLSLNLNVNAFESQHGISVLVSIYLRFELFFSRFIRSWYQQKPIVCCFLSDSNKYSLNVACLMWHGMHDTKCFLKKLAKKQ